MSSAESAASDVSDSEEKTQPRKRRRISDEEQECCSICGENPCSAVTYKDELEKCLENSELQEGIGTSNRKLRFNAYSFFIKTVYFYLGKGQRVSLPICVEKAIKSKYPEPDGKYVGYKEVDDEDDEDTDDDEDTNVTSDNDNTDNDDDDNENNNDNNNDN